MNQKEGIKKIEEHLSVVADYYGLSPESRAMAMVSAKMHWQRALMLYQMIAGTIKLEQKNERPATN